LLVNTEEYTIEKDLVRRREKGGHAFGGLPPTSRRRRASSN